MLRYKTETRPSLVALYDIRPGNGVGQFLQPWSPHGALNSNKIPTQRTLQACESLGYLSVMSFSKSDALLYHRLSNLITQRQLWMYRLTAITIKQTLRYQMCKKTCSQSLSLNRSPIQCFDTVCQTNCITSDFNNPKGSPLESFLGPGLTWSNPQKTGQLNKNRKVNRCLSNSLITFTDP